MTMLFMSVVGGLTACSPDDDPGDPIDPETENRVPDQKPNPNPNPENPDDSGNGNNDSDQAASRNIRITIGGKSFTATLEANEAGNAFAARSPMTITMSEMNGNEKYYYLSDHLPTDSYRPGTIRNGDLMLYGSNCFVIFYKTFASSYSYTRLGRIMNPEDLAATLGSGSVTVTLSPADSAFLSR